MAKRLSLKHSKRRRDQDRAYATGVVPKRHKVAVERSKKAKTKNAYRG